MGRITMTLLLLGAALTAGLSGCGSGSPAASTGTDSSVARTPPPRPETAVSPLFARTYAPAPASEQTHPRITPASGTTTTTFTLRITAHHRLGLTTPVRYAYEILMRGPHPRCSTFTELTIARSGARVPVSLRPPIGLGWCRGTFSGEVLLQTSPSCGPTTGSANTRCTTFAPRLADAGRFEFRTQ